MDLKNNSIPVAYNFKRLFMPRGMYAKRLFIGAEIAFEKINCLANNCQQLFMNEELIILEHCKRNRNKLLKFNAVNAMNGNQIDAKHQ